METPTQKFGAIKHKNSTIILIKDSNIQNIVVVIERLLMLSRSFEEICYNIKEAKKC